MKMWRKLGRKVEQEDGTIIRTGRNIKYQNQMLESLSKKYKKSTNLLDALFKRANIQYALTNKQQEALKTMINNQVSPDQYEEITNETK